MKPYKTCKIESGEVHLDELASYFGLDPKELRWFHNQYCPIEDLIDPDIQSHVDVIYIPIPGADSDYYKTKDRAKPLYEKPNTLSIPRLFEKKYGILQTFYDNGEEKLKLHYEIELNKTGINSLFVDRKPVYFNDKRPDLAMEKLADALGSIFYPLQLELYGNAQLNHIANFPEIQKRWEIQKKQLASYYKGKEASSFLEKIDKQLQYRGKTQQGILDSWFFVLYFFPLYESFGEDNTSTFTTSLPFFPKEKKALFEIKLSIDEKISESKKFAVTAKGKYTNSGTEDKTESVQHDPDTESDPLEGDLEITYQLNAKDNSIYSIGGEMELRNHRKSRKIAFECYELEQ